MAALSMLTVAIVQYVLVSISFIMIVVRIGFSWKKQKRWTTEYSWMVGALCCLVGLLYSARTTNAGGTNNVAHPERLTADQIRKRADASKTAVVARFSYATAIWCLKFCVLAVYSTIVETLPKYKRYIKYIWALLFLTWITAMVVLVFECRPFNHYCVSISNKRMQNRAYPGVCNIITDLILIFYPMPIAFRTRLPLKKKLEICTLFSLGFIIIAISAVRLRLVLEPGNPQQWRTLTGMLEVFAACCVTNGPFFYRLIVNKIRTRNATKTKIDTGNSTGSAASSAHNSPAQTQRTVDGGDLELADPESWSVNGSTVENEIWGVEHNSQEFLGVNQTRPMKDEPVSC